MTKLPKVRCHLKDTSFAPCIGRVNIRWTNSKGHDFMMCKEHIQLMQNIVDEYEQVDKRHYRVVKLDK